MAELTDGHDNGDHSHCDADTCMTAKLKYWREGCGAPLKFTYGRERFSGPTIRERVAHEYKEAEKQGIEIKPYNPRYDGKRSS